jgi:1-acyl-sn-glycerol-3-phosphate acyltransferase
VIPHTSNWDFPVGILLKFGYRMDVQYIAKHTLFRPPFGWFFRWTGGIPVDRSKKNNFVNAMVETLKKYDKISLSLAPEGTRKKVKKLKSGFYWIAHKSNVPLIFVRFDWGKKIVSFSDPFHTTGEYEADLKVIKEHFKSASGRIPEYGIYYEKDQS